jgi:O-antigen/teichoic acid export membrane protein
MRRIGTISKNVSALVGAKILASGLSFILALVINRYLGPERAGIYIYAFALYTIFQVLPDFGIGNISIRDISQNYSRMQRYFVNIVPLRLILAFGAFALLNIINLSTLLFQSPNAMASEKFWVVLSVSFCFFVEQPLSNSLAENFIAIEKLTTVAFVYLIMGIAKVIFSVYVIVADLGPVLVFLMLIYLVTQIYSVFHFYIIYHRLMRRESYFMPVPSDMALAETIAHTPELYGKTPYESLVADYSYAKLEEKGEPPREDEHQPLDMADFTAARPPEDDPSSYTAIGPFRWDIRLWRYLLKSSWPLAVAASGVTIYAMIDIPILSWVGGDTDVGMYGAATMFSKAFVFLTIAINMALLPAISKVGGTFPQRLGKLWERILRYSLLLSIPLATLTPILARPVLILQEHEFINAWHAVWLTIAAMIFTLMTSITFPFFIVINRQKKISALVLLGIIIKGALDFVAIPLWGYTGAAVVVLVSEVLVVAVIYYVLSREIGYRIKLLRLFAVPAIILVILYATTFFLYTVPFGEKALTDVFSGSLQYALIIAVIVSILFIVLAYATRLFSRKDLNELNDLLTV